MTQMTLKQAVRNAIAIEHAAEQFYRTLSDSTKDEDAKAFLDEMADQERCHQRRIRSLSEEMDTGKLPFRADDNVELVETAPAWADVDEVSYNTALSIALENEQHAVLYYSALSDASNGKMAEFFETLMQDEALHVERLTVLLSQGL